ncbi:hypothetical protein D9M68_367200 [compost metagenome]
MSRPALHPPDKDVAIAVQVDESDGLTGTFAQKIAIAALQRRAGDDDRRITRCQLPADLLQPRPAVCIAERNARRHLADVFLGMQRIALDETVTAGDGDGLTDRGLAGTRHTHHQD